MSRIFKTRHFHRWMGKTNVTDQALVHAVTEMTAGLVDARLGGHVVKKRVALEGRGKSGGVRTIVATHFRGYWFFLYGFEKSARANITDNELEALKTIAADLLALDDNALNQAVAQNKLMEIIHENDTNT